MGHNNKEKEMNWKDLVGKRAIIKGVAYRCVMGGARTKVFQIRHEKPNTEHWDKMQGKYRGQGMTIEVTDTDPAGKILKPYFEAAK
jgi:hypothetical protein